MIEILDYGKLKVITCSNSNCGCKFKYDTWDIKDGKIACPMCKTLNTGK